MQSLDYARPRIRNFPPRRCWWKWGSGGVDTLSVWVFVVVLFCVVAGFVGIVASPLLEANPDDWGPAFAALMVTVLPIAFLSPVGCLAGLISIRKSRAALVGFLGNGLLILALLVFRSA
jgi:hypothetical protein